MNISVISANKINNIISTVYIAVVEERYSMLTKLIFDMYTDALAPYLPAHIAFEEGRDNTFRC